jgi:hypothetical protein
MATLTFDFLLGSEWSSRVIARFGKATGGWSHVAPVLADSRYCDARDDVLGGVPAGVHIRLPKTEKAVKRERWAMEVSQDVYTEWEANLRARIGTPYGQGDILDFIVGRPGHVAGHWICSAHAVNSLQHVKLVPFPLPWEAHELTPSDALLIVATIGFKLVATATQTDGLLPANI